MAKAKSGGTRSYIRGRVGADVYSIGKDGLGKKQQVVRSLAETVANPQTEAQMRGRMIMSTVMQAVAEMSGIIDHSFDGVVKGQPSISEFIRRNYALIKADVAAHPSSGASFSLVPYREKGMMPGAYVISDGEVTLTGLFASNTMGQIFRINLEDDTTMGHLAQLWGLGKDDYVTFIAPEMIDTDSVDGPIKINYARFRCLVDAESTTAITAGNIATAFDVEANCDYMLAFSSTSVSINVAANEDDVANYGKNFWIISKKTESGYEHSALQLNLGNAFNNTADAVLPTYPQGEELFLNGGDI